ncbi:MAG TPA: MFS transporter, partial [Ardenticatenaceae bacterium]|nr:MFS transporter [Ardenticatenaceae bacterium]
SRNNKRVLASLLLWGIGEGLFFFIQAVFLERLGANPVQVGFALALAQGAVLLSFLPAGWLSDRFDRKANMLGGYVLGAAASFAMAIAHDWRSLVVGLVLYAISGFCIPAITSYVAQEAAPRERNRILTTVFAGYSVGLVISPAVGGWLAEQWSIQGVFVVSGLAFVLATLTVISVDRQPRPETPLAMRAAWQQLWQQPGVPRLAFLLALFFVAASLGMPLAPNFLARAGYDLGDLGALGSVHAIGAVIWGLVLGRLDERGTRGLLLGGVALALYAAVLVLVPPWPVVVVAFLVRGAFHALRSVASARLAAGVPDTSLGLAFGLLSTILAGSLMVASWLAGLLFARGPTLPFLVSLAALPPVLLALWLNERRSRGVEEQGSRGDEPTYSPGALPTGEDARSY